MTNATAQTTTGDLAAILAELIGDSSLSDVLIALSQHCEDVAEFETSNVKRAKLNSAARTLDKLAATVEGV